MDILEFAINMETEGEKLYRELAEENRGNALFPVFTTLAEDELRHSKILAARKAGSESSLDDSRLSNVESIFKDKGQFGIDYKVSPNQLDSYRKAIAREQESINLYGRFLSEAESIYEIDLYGYLVEQEKLHYNTLEDIIYHLERAESWVESPEFGVREDY